MIGAFLHHARTLFAILAFTTFVFVLAASTRWVLYDTPAWMLYEAWAVDALGRTPYVDLVDHHPPGAIAASVLAGRVFGYSLAGARFADLACMAVILALLWTLVRSHGRMAAVATIAIAGLVHMRGIYMLEREAMAMVPVLAGVLVLSWPRLSGNAGTVLAGIAFGATAWIKPTLAIAWPFVLVWLWWRERRVRAIAAFLAGLALTALPVALYLLWTGSLGAFLDVVRHLWPAYAAYAPARVGWEAFAPATPLRWLAPAAVGAWLSWRSGNAREQQLVTLLAALAIAYAIYPALGHFWANEWLPLQYIAIALAAGCLALVRKPSRSVTKSPLPDLPDLRAHFALIFFMAFVGRYVWLPDEFLRQLATGNPHSAQLSEALGVASALEARGGSALRAQPLDYNDGALTVMLAARSTLATSFIWDPGALPDSPYVRSLRERLIAELVARPPDILIWSEYSIASATNAGNDTYRELEAFMRDYRPILRTASLVVYEHQAVDGARLPDDAHRPRGAVTSAR